MKKTILMTLAALGLAGAAQADSYTPTDRDYSGRWVYVWTGNTDNVYNKDGNWDIYQGLSSDTPDGKGGGNGYPAAADVSFFGWDMSTDSGHQVLTSNNKNYSVTWTDEISLGSKNPDYSAWYLGTNVNISSTSTLFLGINNDSNNNDVLLYFASLESSTSSIHAAQLFNKKGTVSIGGSLNLTEGQSFSHTILTADQVFYDDNLWDASSIDATDFDGSALEYAGFMVTIDGTTTYYDADGSALTDGTDFGGAGSYWLEIEMGQELSVSYNPNEDFSVTIVAQATPEPTTATLSLLALAGLCARRRRK